MERPRNLLIIAVAYTSHKRWTLGVQRALERQGHRVAVHLFPGTEWKWRLHSDAALCEGIARDAARSMGIYGFDVVLVDGLVDASLVAARLRAQGGPIRTQVVAYFHENQLTAPTAPGDRDVGRGLHWLHGARNWQTVLAADRVLFNSRTQLDAFFAALPAFFSGQCRDKGVRGAHGKLVRAVRSKTGVLHYGLDLEELRREGEKPASGPGTALATDGPAGQGPLILWNARLEADKNPDEFLQVLQTLAQEEPSPPFRVVVLGSDTSQDGKYSRAFKEALGDRLLFLGFCEDRRAYGQWLCRADIMLVTAHHETFGISVAEAAFCGVYPILPRRLSYPELLNPKEFPGCFYGKRKSAAAALGAAIDAFANGGFPALGRGGTEQSWADVCGQISEKMERFTWKSMLPHYEAMIGAGTENAPAKDASVGPKTEGDSDRLPARTVTQTTTVTDAGDPRVALFRPKSLRDTTAFAAASSALQDKDWAMHGGRKATKRMLHAAVAGRAIVIVSVLCTQDIADDFLPLCREAGVQEVLVADK